MSFPAIPEPTIMPMAGATSSRPASSALRPWTIWKYWVRKKNVTNMANSTTPISRTAPVRSRSRRKRSGSIGVLARVSTAANATRSAAEAANEPTTTPLSHPTSPPRMIP